MGKLIFNPVRKLFRALPDKSLQQITIEQNNAILDRYFTTKEEEEQNIARAQDE